MGQNSVDYHMGRVHCLVWCVVFSVLAYLCLQFLLSADLRAGTVDVARLRFLNSLPFEGRIFVVGVVLALVVVLAGGMAFRISSHASIRSTTTASSSSPSSVAIARDGATSRRHAGFSLPG
jgi:hypothetical protein